jgi:hypothetical protein
VDAKSYEYFISVVPTQYQKMSSPVGFLFSSHHLQLPMCMILL